MSNENIRRAVVIVAGGKGLRMGVEIPKQFLNIGDKPVLMWTIERFLSYDPSMQIVLVLPESQQDRWHKLCDKHQFSAPYVIANGGETRFHSVKNGIAKVNPDTRLIGVHDGVRPFVSNATISECYDEAERSGAAVPAMEVVETVRQLTSNGKSHTVPRSEYRLIQTPQVFSAAILRQAYEQPFRDFFTDDASVVESLGHEITLVQGNKENIKITTPFDLAVAEVLCRET